MNPASANPNAEMKRHLVACLRAAIDAVEPSTLVATSLRTAPLRGRPAGEGRAPGSSVYLLAVGKASLAMTRGALEVLEDSLSAGLMVLPTGYPDDSLPGVEIVRGEHPVPGEGSAAAGERVAAFCRALPPNAQVLCLISGGASSLLALPAQGVSLDDLGRTTALLLEAGATIDELNTVRKHLDDIKGGGLAQLMEGADVRALILSDVVGDRLDVIASGPLSPDPTTYEEATLLLKARGVSATVPEAVIRHLEEGAEGKRAETPSDGDPCFERVETVIVGNGALAARAAAETAESLGYHTRVLTTGLVGEAREVGADLAVQAKNVRAGQEGPALPACLVAAGETTVTVVGPGRGGRNLELVLGAAVELQGHPEIAMGSAGTDGVDGSSDTAGAIVTPDTLARSRAKGLDPERALRENNSHEFFEALGDGILTGPTGTNAGDVQVVLVRGAPRSGGQATSS